MRKAVQSTIQPILKSKNEMIYQDVYSVFVTKDLKASKIFYRKWFNWKVTFESSFFVLFVTPGEKSFSIGFLSEDHPSSPPTCPPMNSKSGAFLTIQVEDARADFERLRKGGLKINYNLKDERWGQRRFGIVDPNGMYIDVVQQIQPEKGFWEKYPPES